MYKNSSGTKADMHNIVLKDYNLYSRTMYKNLQKEKNPVEKVKVHSMSSCSGVAFKQQ